MLLTGGGARETAARELALARRGDRVRRLHLVRVRVRVRVRVSG